MLSAVNISGNRIHLSTFRLIDPAAFAQEDKRTSVQPGDVLLTVVGAIGRAAVVSAGSPRFTLQRSVAVLSPIIIDPKFLMYQIEAPRFSRHLEANARGTAQKGVYLGTLGRLEVWLPPHAEQGRIVTKIEELFSELDKGVESLMAAREQLKAYRQSLLKHAFEGRLTADWRAANPTTAKDVDARIGALETQRQAAWANPRNAFKRGEYRYPVPVDDTDLPTIPQGWGLISADAWSYHITSGSRDWSRYYDKGSATFVMAQNVRPGKYNAGFTQNVDPPKLSPETERTRVAENDILVTIVGANTGQVCRFNLDSTQHYVCQSVALIRPVLHEYSDFINFYFQSESGGRRQYKRYIYGAGRPHLSFEQIKRTPVPLPDRREAALIGERLSTIFESISRIEELLGSEILRANALRQAVLRRAFSGQLVPQDLNDEPAYILLERIRAERESNSKPKKTTKRTKGEAA